MMTIKMEILLDVCWFVVDVCYYFPIFIFVEDVGFCCWIVNIFGLTFCGDMFG